MRFGCCDREHELAGLLHQGQLPDAFPPDLRAHLEACNACRELVAVTQAFRRERNLAAGSVRLESPGVIWWRAQLRRRNAALERIQRPLIGAQIFAVVISLAAAALLFGTQLRRGFDWLAWMGDLPRALNFAALLPSALQNPAAIGALAVVLVLAIAAISGALVYATSDKR